MDAKIAHLQLIQATVSRLAANSFLLKGWSVSLVAALFALAAADANALFAYLAYFPAFMFWGLDAYFLKQERLFRALYDQVRSQNGEVDFSMATDGLAGSVKSQAEILFSKTVLSFHGTLIATIVVTMVVLMRRG